MSHPPIKLHPLNQGFVWQAPPPPASLRRLTPEQYQSFNDLGFTLVEQVFTSEEIAAVTRAIDPIEAQRERYIREHQGGRVQLSEADIITFTIHIVRESQVLRDFAAHPALKDICHDIIGNDVRLYWDQSVYKKTGKPQEFPWHQDNGYTFVEPQQYLTVWIPLVDVDAENGCPWIAPRLHKLGTLDHWLTHLGKKCLERVDDAICVPAKAGDAIVFSSLAPHRTGPNLKQDTVRKAYILQYAPDGAEVVTQEGTRVAQTDPGRQFKILDDGR
jgi:ectoine hydroxylase-related dioxygenase (phytanoyl-CoA dioxygenase family)